MNFQGLKTVFADAGVSIVIQTRARVPTQRLLREGVAAIVRIRLDFSVASEASEPDEDPIGLTPMHVRDLPESQRGRKGLLIASDWPQAAVFLLDHWEPKGHGPLDTLIREVRGTRQPRHRKIGLLTERLQQEPDEDEYELPFFPRSRRWQRRRRVGVWIRSEFERMFQRVSRASPDVFLPASRHYPGLAFVVNEQSRTVSGHRVPVWDFLTCSDRERGIERIHAYIGGQWLTQPLSRMDERVFEKFERSGRFVAVSGGDLFWGETLEPQFVLKVPAGIPPAAARQSGALPEVARDLPAAYLLDSRCPLAWSKEVAVIEDPGAVWAILMRTSGGVFLPDAAAEDVPRRGARGGQYLVAATPASGTALARSAR